MTDQVAEKSKSLESKENELTEVTEDRNKLQSEKKVLEDDKNSLEKEVSSLKSDIEELNKFQKELEDKVAKKNFSQEKVSASEASSNNGEQSSSDSLGWKTMTVNASAYTMIEHGDKMGGSGLTSTGTVPTANKTIAVDPSVIPYGSKIRYNGVTYTAEDTGGVIDGYKVDIYVNTLNEALNFGRKNINIEVQFP